MADIERLGAIKIERGGGIKSNTYFFTLPPITVIPLSGRHPSHKDTGEVSQGYPSPITVIPKPKENPNQPKGGSPRKWAKEIEGQLKTAKEKLDKLGMRFPQTEEVLAEIKKTKKRIKELEDEHIYA